MLSPEYPMGQLAFRMVTQGGPKPPPTAPGTTDTERSKEHSKQQQTDADNVCKVIQFKRKENATRKSAANCKEDFPELARPRYF
ncbi:hypothetical protein [uncultured Abyssibacter sp.]|uniref:hypothetical protein n=1 Tax=uncultured Abyssibacter sp. TaxID=2320202 RepID=UPI0032B24F01